MLRVRGRSFTFLWRKTRLSHKEALEEMKKELRDYSRVCYRSVSLIKRTERTRKTLSVSFSASPLLRLPFSASAAPVIIYFRGCGEETAGLEHIGRNVIRSAGPQSICADCCGQPGGRPALTLVRAARRHMVSYLIVRLEMQYLHILSRTGVTSPGGASHVPEKRAHGAERKSKQKVV